MLTACRCSPGRAFLGFVTRSRNVRNRLDGAKELKKLVYFSNIVVSPLLEDLQVHWAASSTFVCVVRQYSQPAPALEICDPCQTNARYQHDDFVAYSNAADEGGAGGGSGGGAEGARGRRGQDQGQGG
jgi:Chloroplast envelope transporter